MRNPKPKDQNIIHGGVVIMAGNIVKAKNAIRSINHPLRKEIISLIHTKGKLNMSQIQHALQLDQSVTSQQLAIMRKTNVLKPTRVGKEIWYSVNYDTMKVLETTIDTLSKLVK